MCGYGHEPLRLEVFPDQTAKLVKQLVEEGKYRPVIDRTYALEDIVEATRYVESGQKTGNVVLRVSEAPSGATWTSQASVLLMLPSGLPTPAMPLKLLDPVLPPT